MDEYSKIVRSHTPAVITGKPIQLGGSLGRDDATGRGAYYCIKELERHRGWTPSEVLFAVQGFGNAGQHVAALLHHVYEIMQAQQISMRTAAYVHALNRLGDAIAAQGTQRYFSGTVA